jgi:hypothetical protein
MIENHTPSLWFKKSIQKPQVSELLRLCPETSTKLYSTFMNSTSGEFSDIKVLVTTLHGQLIHKVKFTVLRVKKKPKWLLHKPFFASPLISLLSWNHGCR